jgi:hypothetical protein
MFNIGGIFALCALLTGKRSKLSRRAKNVVNIVSILSASFLIGMNKFSNKIILKSLYR